MRTIALSAVALLALSAAAMASPTSAAQPSCATSTTATATMVHATSGRRAPAGSMAQYRTATAYTNNPMDSFGGAGNG